MEKQGKHERLHASKCNSHDTDTLNVRKTQTYIETTAQAKLQLKIFRSFFHFVVLSTTLTTQNERLVNIFRRGDDPSRWVGKKLMCFYFHAF
eukprot:g80495.t1